MAIDPNSSFPLLASDQADIIRMFLDLMIDSNRAGRVSEVRATKEPLEPRDDSND
jgi:hypothetical protein